MLWWILIPVFAVIALLLFIFPVVQISGNSMNPTFNDGDIILGCRLFSLKVSDVYVYTPPVGHKYVIKRLSRISRSRGNLFFEGDNPNDSYDSRMYGYVDRDKIVARYVFTIYKRKECKSNGCK